MGELMIIALVVVYSITVACAMTFFDRNAPIYRKRPHLRYLYREIAIHGGLCTIALGLAAYIFR